MVATKGSGGKREELSLSGDRVSDLQDEEVLEIHFTTMCVYLVLLNQTLKK